MRRDWLALMLVSALPHACSETTAEGAPEPPVAGPLEPEQVNAAIAEAAKDRVQTLGLAEIWDQEFPESSKQAAILPLAAALEARQQELQCFWPPQIFAQGQRLGGLSLAEALDFHWEEFLKTGAPVEDFGKTDIPSRVLKESLFNACSNQHKFERTVRAQLEEFADDISERVCNFNGGAVLDIEPPGPGERHYQGATVRIFSLSPKDGGTGCRLVYKPRRAMLEASVIETFRGIGAGLPVYDILDYGAFSVWEFVPGKLGTEIVLSMRVDSVIEKAISRKADRKAALQQLAVLKRLGISDLHPGNFMFTKRRMTPIDMEVFEPSVYPLSEWEDDLTRFTREERALLVQGFAANWGLGGRVVPVSTADLIYANIWPFGDSVSKSVQTQLISEWNFSALTPASDLELLLLKSVLQGDVPVFAYRRGTVTWDGTPVAKDQCVSEFTVRACYNECEAEDPGAAADTIRGCFNDCKAGTGSAYVTACRDLHSFTGG